MRLSLVTAVLLATAQLVSANEVEHLGQPCRAMQILGACTVADRHDGRERLVLMNDNETLGAELLYIDFEKNTGQMYPAPGGAGSWTVIEVPGDRLVTGTFYDGKFMVFDLKQMKFIKVIDFPGEEYIWNLVLGSDGRVYGGTYPGGKLGAIDLSTYAFEDLGAPAAPNQYLRTVSYAPWGQIFAQFMMNAITTKVYDIQAKAWREVPNLKEGQQITGGVEWNGYYVASDPRHGRVCAYKDASLIPVEKLPFPVPESGTFAVDPALTTKHTLFLRQGNAVFSYHVRQPEFKLNKIAEIDLRGGRYLAATKSGTLLGIRGQSYFAVEPGDSDVKLRRIPVEARGRPSLFLKADDQGRLWGGPHFGQTIFSYDIKTRQTNNTGVVCDGGGEVYDVAFHEGSVYAASYAGGDITCYDPSKPWDQWGHSNPRPVAQLGKDGYIRPLAGIVTGPDSKLYAGWMAKYGVYGGAISITDPKTGKTELIENPLGTQAVASFAVDAKYLYIGTTLGANGLPNQAGPAKFGVVELASRRVVFEKEFEVTSVQHVVREPVTGLVTLATGGTLHLFDPDAKAVSSNVIADLPSITAYPLVPVGDGTLLAGSDKKLLRIDLQKKAFHVEVEAPKAITRIALAADGRVYLTHEADLYRVTEPIKRLTRATSP